MTRPVKAKEKIATGSNQGLKVQTLEPGHRVHRVRNNVEGEQEIA